MKGKNTDELFFEVIHQRAIHKKIEMTSDAVRAIRSRIKKGETVSEDLKSNVLSKAGYVIVQERLWG